MPHKLNKFKRAGLTMLPGIILSAHTSSCMRHCSPMIQITHMPMSRAKNNLDSDNQAQCLDSFAHLSIV